MYIVIKSVVERQHNSILIIDVNMIQCSKHIIDVLKMKLKKDYSAILLF